MSGTKQSGSTTTIQSSEPWSGQEPYLIKGFKRAESQLEQPLSYYPNSTVVPFSNQTEGALSAMEARARAGSPLLRSGQGAISDTVGGSYLSASPARPTFSSYAGGTGGGQSELSKTAAGNYLGANSYLDKVVDKSVGRAGAAIDARFSNAGRYGSGQHLRSLADDTGALAASIYAPAYEAERGRMVSGAANLAGTQLSGAQGLQSGYDTERRNQLTSAALTPNMAQADYGDLSKLGAVGAAREGLASKELEDQINRYMFSQTAQRDALKEYMAAIAGGSYGGTTVAQTPLYSDPWGQALGTGVAAAGMAGTLFGQQGVWPGGF